MAEVKPEDMVHHPPMDQLQGFEYCIGSNPSWGEAIALGFQHYILSMGIAVMIPTMLVPLMGGNDEWQEEVYPPYANGPGYVISSDIAQYIVSEFDNQTLRLFKMEDVSMGMWIEKFNSTRRPVEYLDDGLVRARRRGGGGGDFRRRRRSPPAAATSDGGGKALRRRRLPEYESAGMEKTRRQRL